MSCSWAPMSATTARPRSAVPEFASFESTGTRDHTAPRHRHASETFIVLDGEMLIVVGDEQRVASPGHTAVLPRDMPHTFVIVSQTTDGTTFFAHRELPGNALAACPVRTDVRQRPRG
jgi:quercetin dioxygenase-like cupin family protein